MPAVPVLRNLLADEQAQGCSDPVAAGGICSDRGCEPAEGRSRGSGHQGGVGLLQGAAHGWVEETFQCPRSGERLTWEMWTISGLDRDGAASLLPPAGWPGWLPHPVLDAHYETLEMALEEARSWCAGQVACDLAGRGIAVEENRQATGAPSTIRSVAEATDVSRIELGQHRLMVVPIGVGVSCRRTSLLPDGD